MGIPGGTGPRPILCTTVRTIDKHRILKAKRKLKENPQNLIAIQPERTSDEQKEYKLLNNFAKNLETTAKTKCYIKNSELFVTLHGKIVTYIVVGNEVVRKQPQEDRQNSLAPSRVVATPRREKKKNKTRDTCPSV